MRKKVVRDVTERNCWLEDMLNSTVEFLSDCLSHVKDVANKPATLQAANSLPSTVSAFPLTGGKTA